MTPLPIRQIAYFVPDARAAALAHHRLHGSGPYFVAGNIPLRLSLHRDVPRPLDHTSAYGQWGGVMIEFVQQNNPGPSAFHDVYPEGSGRQGVHHVALFVDDLAAAIASFNGEGHETALYAEMADGFAFAMIDTVALHGHMLELYEPRPELTGFYDYVARKAEGFDGRDPVRTIRLG
jgi:catechol 2,3-dioxygenase-like lactoylglutathione lyase family enzyme